MYILSVVKADTLVFIVKYRSLTCTELPWPCTEVVRAVLCSVN